MGSGKTGRFFHKPARYLRNRILITSGDPAGIGLQTACRALLRLGPKKNLQFLIWTEHGAADLHIPPFKTQTFETGALALQSLFKEDHILQIKSPGGPMEWLTAAGRLCWKGEAQALVTGPVRKKLLGGAVGQTALLKSLCGAGRVFMCFRGEKFNVVLLTDHIPLKKLAIRPSALRNCLRLALKHRALLAPALQKKALGVLGLNPHAGEEGLMGREEEDIIKPLLKEFPQEEVQGPLSPDSAFLRKNHKLYSFFIALYHDQGLIPFKAAHAHTGFAQSLGLPFLRLGVDHGAGLTLKGDGVCSDSFFAALKEAVRLVSGSGGWRKS